MNDLSNSGQIKLILKALNLTQTGLAAKLGLSQGVISEFVSASRVPSKEFLLGLPKLGISLDWFLTGNGEMFLNSDTQSMQSTGKEIAKSPITGEFENLIKKTVRPEFESIETRLKRIEETLLSQYPPNDGADSSYEVNEEEPEYSGTWLEVPFVDSVAAGPPIEQQEFPDEKVMVSAVLIKCDSSEYYAARVQGESMTEAGIPDGSIILIRHTDVPRENGIQLVRRSNRSTLKRVCNTGGNWELRYEDGTNRVIKIDSGDFQVQGDFIAVLPETSLVKTSFLYS